MYDITFLASLDALLWLSKYTEEFSLNMTGCTYVRWDWYYGNKNLSIHWITGLFLRKQLWIPEMTTAILKTWKKCYENKSTISNFYLHENLLLISYQHSDMPMLHISLFSASRGFTIENHTSMQMRSIGHYKEHTNETVQRQKQGSMNNHMQHVTLWASAHVHYND
jgi:hypothetical protein